ncbi:NfeD family protein [Aurantiacibacter luteus]|uniref:NfeD family protein n=1 Tax=Aurantiacibacter luteus TaxID=1581420 RepID=UPI000A50615E
MDWLSGIAPHWLWLALGLLLAAAEIVAPGVFLIWLGVAALVTGVVAWVLPIGVPMQVLAFAVLSVVAVYIGRNYVRANPIAEPDPMLNRRGARLVGEVGTAVVAFSGGEGRIRLGDSEWLARGPDCAPGDRVRVTGSDGAILLVERMSSP